MSAALTVFSAGAVTPVGLSMAQTCAAVRAGISAFAESAFDLGTTETEPVVTATVPLKPSPVSSKPSRRLTALARTALRECLRSGDTQPARTALILGVLEEERAHLLNEWFEEDVYDVLRRKILAFFHQSSVLLPRGNTAVFAGLETARQLLEAGVVDACLVGGVDSFVNAVDIGRFRETWRLHREGESYGLVPGEAAAFIGVTTSTRATGDGVLGQIAGIGLDQEDASTTVLSDGHPTGRGLERALVKAVRHAQIAESAIGLRVSDLNGERYGSMDSLLALSRFYRTDRDGLPIWHPAECVGETGAAVGAVLLQIACHAFGRGYSPSRTVICEASSERGHRAACVIRPANGQERVNEFL